jgi:hypothetical protein
VADKVLVDRPGFLSDSSLVSKIKELENIL